MTWRRRRAHSAPSSAAALPVATPRSASLALPIVTQRLVLRDFEIGDLEAVLAYLSDPQVTELMFFGPRDAEATRKYLDEMHASRQARPRRIWELAVVERASGGVIGSCDLTLADERVGDLGYIFARSAWGRGFATETARAMVRAGFEQLRLDRIFAMCERDHRASRRVLDKAGLRSRGVIEGVRQAKGRSWDMWLYDLQRPEWEAMREAGERSR